MQDIMGQMDIAFPHLHIYLNNVPKSFFVFGFEITFYGIIIGLGLFLGFSVAIYEARRSGQDENVYWDFILYALFFSLAGARIYYVVFRWDTYKNNLWHIFNLREGGLAIYGAVIAAFLTATVYCKIKKLSFFQFADTGVLGLILGQAVGRWGNFMNREAFGEYTDSLFAMRLPIEAVRPWEITENVAGHILEGTNYIQVHPTFLYESIWNLAIFAALFFYTKYKRFQGEVTVLYLGGYGLGRFMIERLRTDQLLIPHTGIAVSQMLAGVLVVFALVVEGMVWRRRLGKERR